MNKKKIEIEYIKKIRLINKYNKFYYDKNKPLVSDQEYDQLKKKFYYLKKNMIFLNLKTHLQKL